MSNSSSHTEPNRLIHSTSPYLLQHAYNPVQWYEWGAEALGRATAENKPILVSIGYSSCHWCHVMEHESFENDDIANIMNEFFICIKVDREERPDIDQIYMEAVQAMQQHGGWPLNVFLTPNQKPFYGGTYFPPQNWAQLLLQIDKAFKQRRNEIDESAEEIRKHLQTSDLRRFAKEPGTEKFTTTGLDNMFRKLEARFDSTWGGLAQAPKFVMPSIWLYLLRHYTISKNEDALQMVGFTLHKMTMGGLYDQIGGGFSRYSVDAEWFAPHFEKMLYDNAQLLSLYSEAYSITNDMHFKAVVYDTVTWLTREMTHPEGGFYSALDADSEGVEGKFYTWTWNELKRFLMDIPSEYYGATEEGNWEHGRNILMRTENIRPFLSDLKINETEFLERTKVIQLKLLSEREKRIRPGLDDKVLSGWNAMMVQGLTDAYKAFGDTWFLELAKKNMAFIESKLISNGKLHRAFRNKQSGTEGFLEDYAYLIQAYTTLYQVTFHEDYLRKAEHWTIYTWDNFFDASDGYFHFASGTAEKLIARRKEIFDNVIPSSNSVMARNLYHLGILVDNALWKQQAINMASGLAEMITSEPGYMSHWGILYAEITHGLSEVVISGNDAEQARKQLQAHYIPLSLTLGTETRSALPLLEGRDSKDGKTMIYVCSNKTCKLPVNNVEDALKQLKE